MRVLLRLFYQLLFIVVYGLPTYLHVYISCYMREVDPLSLLYRERFRDAIGLLRY
jgi:hypothetical protein